MKKRVLVGISGGVDSAVTAHLLQEQGYEVIAGFMKNYATEGGNCTTRIDRDDAIKAAQFLGIDTFIIFDFRDEYKERVLDYIFDNYKKGITPNPDVLCNSLVKFDIFAEKAKQLGCDFVATGHYARIEKEGDKAILMKGIDHTKDQSYFLSGLTQKQLQYALMPLGEYTKDQVREIAKKIGLPNADRKDSQGLCFVGNVPIKDFLMQRLPEQQGEVLDSDGKTVGKHDGAWFYTLGQRRGFDVPFQCYVTGIDVEKNIITVSGDKDHPNLTTKKVTAKDWHWIDEETTDYPHKVSTKIRYRQEPQAGELTSYDTEKNIMIITCDEEQWAVTPGQVAVAYDGDRVIGHGIIA